jgi:hypothetical protein
MVSVILTILRRRKYQGLFLLTSFIIVSFAILLPHQATIAQFLSSPTLGPLAKAWFVLSLYGSLWTNMSVVQVLYLMAISLLFGLNITLLAYYIRRRQGGQKSTSLNITSAAGMLSAMFGLGCIACGSVVLTAIFGLAGASAIIAFLPWHGTEFGVVGIGLLVISIWYMLKRINDPLVCPID